jgi:hypothetical protein
LLKVENAKPAPIELGKKAEYYSQILEKNSVFPEAHKI